MNSNNTNKQKSIIFVIKLIRKRNNKNSLKYWKKW